MLNQRPGRSLHHACSAPARQYPSVAPVLGTDHRNRQLGPNCVLRQTFMSDTIEAVKPIRFTRASRKHRVGKKSAYHVIAMNAATITDDPDTGETTLSWVAGDERGRELEIVAIEPIATSSST